MVHLKPISRTTTVQTGTTDAVESVILLLMAIIFKDWDNFAQVAQNLQKYFAKTP